MPNLAPSQLTILRFGFLHAHRQHVADRLCRLDLRGRRDVGIGVEREARAEMPEHAADRFDVYAVLERERGERVP